MTGNMKKLIILVFVFFIVFWSSRTIGLLISFIYPDRQVEVAYQSQNRIEIDKWIAVSKFTHSGGYIMAWNLIGLASGFYAVYLISKRWKY